MNKIKCAICTLALVVSAGAQASTDGKVTFSGALLAETCSVVESSKDITVPLPKIAIQRLVKDGDQAGSTTFNIQVENCPEGFTKVAAHFEAIVNEGFDPATGNLINSAPAEPIPAKNVQVRLYNTDDSKPIAMGQTGHFFPIDATTHKSTMTYAGGYYATGATEAGPVRAQVQYVLAYP